MSYKFNEPKSTACIVCCHVLEKSSPILYVTHDEDDGMWQFLCGESNHNEETARIVSLEQVVEMDSSINDLYEMPCGVGAERDEMNSKWKPFKL